MKNKEVRKLTRVGKKSFMVTLLPEEIRSLGWKEGQNLSVKRVKGGFLVKDWRRK